MDFEGYTAIDLHSFCTRPVSALIWNQSGTATSSEAGSVVRVKLLAILDILWLRPSKAVFEGRMAVFEGRLRHRGATKDVLCCVPVHF